MSRDLVRDENVEGRASIVEEAKRSAVKFCNQHRRFYQHLYLALSVGLYMTLFGLPVYSENIRTTVFGQDSYISRAGKKIVNVTGCRERMLGMAVNIGNDSDPILVPFNSSHVLDRFPDVWCGLLPGSYFNKWPGVVQCAMFTVLRNTGTTVRLAWETLSGTFIAVANIYLLELIFPRGAKDENYIEAVVWADFVLLVFFLLASGCAMNTKIMGINWSVFLLMHFMNPNKNVTEGKLSTIIPRFEWDSEASVVMLTSVIGVMIAILATVFPYPLKNISRVHQEAVEIVDGIDSVLFGALECYKKQDPGAKRFQLYAKMLALRGTVNRAISNLHDSFWETFNIGHNGRKRRLYASFMKAMDSCQQTVYPLKAALEPLANMSKHREFAPDLAQPLEYLISESMACLRLCAKCCEDAVIQENERIELRASVEQIAKEQLALKQVVVNKFDKGSDGSCFIDQELAADSLFIFATSQFARQIRDWAKDLEKFKDDFSGGSAEHNICVHMRNQAYVVWDFKAMFSKENLRFTVKNGLPIIVLFACSLHCTGPFWSQYSTVMPGTLAVLCTKDLGANFFKNLQRLMGVTFGKVLPVLLVFLLQLAPCDSPPRVFMHMLAIFAFYTTFMFVYYASEQWNLVGLLIASFGCYKLFHPCTAGMDQNFEDLYKDIAQVIVAILFKMAVATSLSPKLCRDLAVESMEQAFDNVKFAIQAFSEEKYEGPDGFEGRYSAIGSAISQCALLAPKADPALQMVPMLRTPFKMDLYNKIVDDLRLIQSDLYILKLAIQGYQPLDTLGEQTVAQPNNATNAAETDEARVPLTEKQERAQRQGAILHAYMTRQPAWKTIIADVMNTLDKAFSTCKAVLRHDSEEPLDSEQIDNLMAMTNLMELDGLSEFYTEISEAVKTMADEDAKAFQNTRIVTDLRRMRIMVATNALSLVTRHAADMSTKCLEHMIYF